jgi:hypothetical protein
MWGFARALGENSRAVAPHVGGRDFGYADKLLPFCKAWIPGEKKPDVGAAQAMRSDFREVAAQISVRIGENNQSAFPNVGIGIAGPGESI